MAKKKKKNSFKLKFNIRKLSKKEKKQLRVIGRLAIVAAVAITAVFGTYKGVSYGIKWLMYRNKETVNTIILGDGQKFATAANSVAKKIASSKIAQEDAKSKAQESTAETKKQELEMTTLVTLQDEIDAYIKKKKIDKDDISYKIIDIATGKVAESENSSTNMLAGSVYKLPLCLLWYDMIDEGLVSFEDEYEWGSYVTETEGRMVNKWEEGDMISLSDILAYTLKYSDNVGGHILYEEYGGWTKFKNAITQYSDHEQAEEFFSRKNYLNAEFMCDVWMHIYENQDKYSQLIYYLTIAAPDDFFNYVKQVNMVQKVGFYNEHINSTGLSLEGRPYVICVFTNLGDDAIPVMGEINKMAYEYINDKLPPLASYDDLTTEENTAE